MVVIGGGPAGSSAAAFLAERGVKVALVEKSEFPRRKVCGEFVSATTFPLLEELGVDAVIEQGGPLIRRVGVFGAKTIVKGNMPKVHLPGGWGRSLPRSVLDLMLLNAAAERGASIYQPWKAVELAQSGGQHLCTIECGPKREQLRSPILVLAHGSWEVSSLSTQEKVPNLPTDLLAFKVRFSGADLEDDLMALLSFPGGYGGMVSNYGDTVGLSFCIRRDLLQECREKYQLPNAGENALKYIVGSVGGVAKALENAQMLESPIGAGPLRPAIRSRYSQAVFRVGNAAGEAHPVIAEGISMAIQSGDMLARHLLTGLSMDVMGENYANHWERQFGGRIRAANVYSKLCMNPAAGAILGPLLTSFPSLVTLGAAWSGKSSLISK